MQTIPSFASGQVDVIATGIGKTEEAAKLQAYRNAIRSVIGTMVVSEVLLKNDTLINDTVLSHTDGYIVKSSQVGNARLIEGNLFEITMNVTVKSQQLQEKLKAEKITTIAFDGQKLFAQKKQAQENAFAQKATQEEASKNAAGIIKEKLKILPSGVLHVSTDQKKITSKTIGGYIQLTVPVQVSVDQKAYTTFAKDLIVTMQKMGFEANQVSSGLSVRYSRDSFRLILCDLINSEARRTRWKVFTLTEELFSALIGSYNTFGVKVELLNTSGEVISVNTFTHSKVSYMDKVSQWDHGPIVGTAKGGRNGDRYGRIAILPHPSVRTHNNYSIGFNPNRPIFNFPIVFDLTEEEFKSIAEVKCSLVNVPIK